MYPKSINEALLDAHDANRRLRRRADDLPPTLSKITEHLCDALDYLIEAEWVPYRHRLSGLAKDPGYVDGLKRQAVHKLKTVIDDLQAGTRQDEESN